MAKAFLIVGNTGSGKSTLAAKLAKGEKAHIFSVDEWMKNLYLMDTPDIPSYTWALERTERIEVQMLQDALKLLANDISIILDIGFFKKEQRDRVTGFLKDHGHSAFIYYLDVHTDIRWGRVKERNRGEAATFQFEVSKDIFDFCETLFEPMIDDELKNVTIITT